jgi:hypothetical protein
MTEGDDPPPDLQEFVRRHGDWRRMPPERWAGYELEEQERMRRCGAYSLVTAAEWAEWDPLNAAWQERRRLAYGPAPASPKRERKP